MVACAPIPFLDFFCEAVGAVIESGYQGIAAFEGAKSAIESLSAVVLHRKEQAELALAFEEQGEAARLALEAEKFQVLAEEEGGRAAAEEAEGEASGAAAGEAQLLGEGELEASEEEEALAVLDEEVRISARYAPFPLSLGPMPYKLTLTRCPGHRRKQQKSMPKQPGTRASL